MSLSIVVISSLSSFLIYESSASFLSVLPSNESQSSNNTLNLYAEGTLANWTEILIKSYFNGQGLSRRDQQKQWYLDDSSRFMDCFCEVRLNGQRHVNAEETVCGSRGKISCDKKLGCQKAVAVLRGVHYSVVRSCGSFEITNEHCRQHREQDAHAGNQIMVQRCFCRGWLCNEASWTRSSITIFQISISILTIYIFVNSS